MTTFEKELIDAVKAAKSAMYSYHDAISDYIYEIFHYEDQALAEEVLHQKRKFTKRQLQESLDEIKKNVDICEKRLKDKLENLTQILTKASNNITITYETQNTFNKILTSIMRYYDKIYEDIADTKEIGYELNDIELGLDELNTTRSSLDVKISEFNRRSNLELLSTLQAMKKSRELKVDDVTKIRNDLERRNV